MKQQISTKALALIFLFTTCIKADITLQHLRAYTNKLPESPHQDVNNQTFNSFYRSLQPTLLQRITGWFGWHTTPTWDIQALQKLLKTQNELPAKHAMKLVTDKQIGICIFSNISGSLHSLTRSLSFLEQQGVIDNTLHIKGSTDFIVFNGDLIDDGAYSLECLHVVLTLMANNPSQVFYLRGQHEDQRYWHNYELKQELKARAQHLLPANAPVDTIPLGNEIDQLFARLPLALYVTTVQQPNEAIRISYTGREDKRLQEDLSKTSPALFDTMPHVQALITTQNWLKEHRAAQGLGLLDQDQGATSWSVVSAPLKKLQTFYDFYYDAFAVLNVQIPLDSSTIALWNNDIRTAPAFENNANYYVATGSPVDPNAPKSKKPDIVIGSTMALNRGIGSIGKAIKRGMDIRINEQNITGGINGQHIESIVYNDNYTPYIARQNIERLITVDNTRTLLLPVGTITLNNYLPLIATNDITALFPVTGAPEFRNAQLTGLVNYRPSYADEIEILIDHLNNAYAAQTFLFFYQDDAYGLSGLQAAHQELKNKGITNWIDVPYARGQTDFSKQAQIIRSAQVDAIGLFATAQATQEMIRQVGVDALSNKKLFGLSFLGETSFRSFIKNRGLQVLFGAAVPNPAKSMLPIALAYRQAMDSANLPYDVFSFEAFITTSLLMHAMQQIEAPITREKILTYLEGLYREVFQGLKLTFNPETRSLARFVWIDTGDDTAWIEKRLGHILA